jgi:hypothetical protein
MSPRGALVPVLSLDLAGEAMLLHGPDSLAMPGKVHAAPRFRKKSALSRSCRSRSVPFHRRSRERPSK